MGVAPRTGGKMKKEHLHKILVVIGIIAGTIMINWHLKRTIKEILAEERAQIRAEVKEQAKEAIHDLLKDPITRREVASVVQEGVSNSLNNDLEPAINRILENKFPFLKKRTQ